MTVRNRDMRRTLVGGLRIAFEGRITEKRIEHDDRAGIFDAESRMAEPGELHCVPSLFVSPAAFQSPNLPAILAR